MSHQLGDSDGKWERRTGEPSTGRDREVGSDGAAGPMRALGAGRFSAAFRLGIEIAAGLRYLPWIVLGDTLRPGRPLGNPESGRQDGPPSYPHCGRGVRGGGVPGGRVDAPEGRWLDEFVGHSPNASSAQGAAPRWTGRLGW